MIVPLERWELISELAVVVRDVLLAAGVSEALADHLAGVMLVRFAFVGAVPS